MRWLAAIVVAATAFFTPGAAQDASLQRRVVIESEREAVDPLTVPDESNVANLIGQRFLAASFRNTIGYEILASGVLEAMANDRYGRALEHYRSLLVEDEASLSHSPLSQIRGTDTITSRDTQSLVHDWLARLPAATLRQYQQRIDADADRLLKDGVGNRDARLLRRIVQDYRVSTQADLALAILGDLAFERGEFDLALDWWRRIVPLPSHDLGRVSRRPLHGVDRARIHAKQTLALIFAARPEASREVEAMRKLHPSASGAFAGRDGAYHVILDHWLHAIQSDPTRDWDDAWPTLGGAASRSRVLRKPLDSRLWIDGAAWRLPLPEFNADDRDRFGLSTLRSLSIPATPIHPVIARGQLLINDGQLVRSFDLVSGKPRFRASSAAPFVRRDDLKTPTDLSFGLSTSDNRAFARIGTRSGDPEPRRLIAINIDPAARLLDRVVWTADANGEAALGFFETDPLVVGDRVYIGTLHKGEPRTPRTLSCFTHDGKLLWNVKLADFEEVRTPRPHRQALLVGTGSSIIYATHAGAVFAVDAWTGRRQWSLRYPSIDAGPSPRGASSCMTADGRVFIAPADSANLYCVEADSGRVVWERSWVKPPSDIVAAPPAVSEIVDLLGVVEDRLIFTDRSRIQALDARSGYTLDWQQPVVGKLPTFGRGLLAGRWTFWPTADPDVSWRALAQATGQLHDSELTPDSYEPTLLRSLPAGNIIFGQGCLAIAGPKELVVYVPPAAQAIRPRDPQARLKPAQLYRLAIAEIDAGDDASKTLADLESQVPPREWADWKSLIRERISPRPAKPKPVAVADRSPAVSFVPPAPSSVKSNGRGKLSSAWGPVAGWAPPIECAPATPNDVTVIFDGNEVAFANSHTGEELFRRPRRLAAVDWIGRQGSNVLLAGRDGVECFDVALRRPTWHFPAPALGSPSWQLIDDRPQSVVSPRRLIAFQFVDRALAVFEENDRIIALDPNSGAALADVRVDAVRPLVGGVRFEPVSLGLPNDDIASILSHWKQSPRTEPFDPREARRRVVQLGGQHLQGLDAGVVRVNQSPVKSYRPPFPTSLTGAAAHVFGDIENRFALIPRNQGYDLVRFHNNRLEPLWTVPAIELRDGFDVLEAAWNEECLFFATAGELQARSLESGRIVWMRKLPPASGSWKIQRDGNGLLVWAQSTAGLPALVGPLDPVSAAVTLATGRRNFGRIPILRLDAADGSLQEQIDVPHDGGPAFVHRQGNSLIATAGNRVRAWLVP